MSADKPAAIKRPVTFVFNGGPGAASAYLHLGLAGPRLAEFRAGREGPPRLHDNPQTWLQFTDLVMIDPVGSGFSRPAKADGGSAFWGVARDAESLAKVIAQWIADNHRADSPKFILGESYGGFRAAKVARALRREHGIAVSGIMMVSPLMEGAFTFGGTRFALGAAMQIPSLAAAELERKGTFTPERLAEAERFALNEYLTTLAGPPPRGEAARAFYARVAEITGMPLDVVTTHARLHPRQLREASARRRAADRQPLRRHLHRPRSASRKRDAARARSAARRRCRAPIAARCRSMCARSSATRPT